jgi:hypothetical protein
MFDRAGLCLRLASSPDSPRRFRAVSLGSCCLVALSIVGSGCDVVVTRVPLPRAQDSAFESRLAGSWATADGDIHIRFVEPGFAKFAGVDWEDDAFVLVPGELTLAEIDGRHFLSARFQEDGAWRDRYYLAEVGIVKAGDDVMLIWTPIEERFRALIENGPLQGETEDGVVITSKPEDLLAMLADERAAGAFDLREPMVLRKVHDGPARDEDEPAEAAPEPPLDEPAEPSSSPAGDESDPSVDGG